MTTPARTDVASTDSRFTADHYVVRQKIRPMVNRYEICEAKAGDTSAKPESGAQVALVNQKRLKLREQIVFKDGDTTLFQLTAKKVLELRGSYELTTPDGASIGSLKKAGKASILRSTWLLRDAAGSEVATIQEASKAFAIIRRFLSFIPYIDFVLAFIPYGFEVLAGPGTPQEGKKIGSHTRRLGLRDVYDLNLAGDTAHLVDRRLAMALAVALDALQRR
ncbi:MAG: hypothetical protein JWM98_3129 [Thermoleophilia bacterium]|nr:hypothetical protein [Thermoleophilia bacterium]